MILKTRLTELSKAVEEIIIQEGQYIFEQWQKPHTLFKKSHRNFASEVDKDVEEKLRIKLHALFPEAGFIVEEGKTEKKEYNWVIDPLDGTNYFLHQTPNFYSQIALTHGSKPLISCIYQPVSKQLFSAIKGQGVTLNNHTIQYRNSGTLAEALVDIDGGKKDQYLQEKLELINSISNKAHRIRLYRGAFVPYLITGLFDTYICILSDTYDHDLLPRLLILQEGKAYIKTIHYKHLSLLVASSRNIVLEIETLFTKGAKKQS